MATTDPNNSGVTPDSTTAPTASTFAQPPTPGATQATPALMGNAQNTSTSNQLNGLIAQNSPYLQQAQAGAMSTANDRGLINSSMAAGAGQAAAISAALPIAQSNAQTAYNTNAANQAAQNTAANQNASLATSTLNTGMNNSTALQQTGLSTQAQLQVANISASSQQTIAAAQQANQDLIQNSTAAASSFSNYQAAVAQIDQNTGMDAAAKATAINNQTQIFNQAIAGLKAAGNTSSVPDVSSLLDFGSTAAATPAAPTTYTAPNGQVWASQAAYNATQTQNLWGGA